MNSTRNSVIRSSAAIKTWLPLSLAVGGLTFLLLSTLTSIPPERVAMGHVLTAIRVFSGVFSGVLFRSFGKEKDRYKSY